MTQGFPAQPNYGAPQYQQQPQQYVPPVSQAGGYTVPVPAPQAPQYQQPTQQPAGPSSGFFNQGPNAQVPQPESTTSFFGSDAAYLSWDNAKGYVNNTWYGGRVLGKNVRPQTDMDSGQVRMSKFHPGQPIEEMVLELQTSMRTDSQDDGRRQLPIKSGLVRAAREAFQAAGDNDIQIGSWFYATKTGQELVPNSTGKGTVRRNNFQAVYALPSSPDPAPQPSAQPLRVAAPPPQQPTQYQAPMQQFAQPQQVPGLGYQPVATPGAAPNGYDPAHEAQRAAAMYQQQPAPQFQAQGVQTGTFGRPDVQPQSAQHDPAAQAAIGIVPASHAEQYAAAQFAQIGQPGAPQQYVPQAPPQGQQPAQMPPGYGQFQPGAQQQPPAPNPQSGEGGTPGFNPFG